ncbi:MAG: 50S ribosomal protein L11 methyltransferase [Clostridia bacterium]|nr:50S ribosomal protein L11 methyltransferase [Clostridia bacterium]
MEWIKLSIFTSSEGIEEVCDALYDIGMKDVQIEDEQEFTEFLEENKKYWDYVDDELINQKKGETKVIIYLENDEHITDSISSVQNMLSALKAGDADSSLGRLETETDGLNEEDWANNWKAYFKPIEVGEKILIQPEWEPYNGDTDRIVFTVNPGLTFGTGTHNSTKLCIAELEKVIDDTTDMIDIGCGSGILSVISLLLGAPEATALDIDPNAVHVAYENAEMNNVGKSRYHVYAGDILTDRELQSKVCSRRYKVVVANIVADVIIALLPIVKQIVDEKGTFICSGIINERLPDVLVAMEKQKITVDHTCTDGEWSSVTCKF